MKSANFSRPTAASLSSAIAPALGLADAAHAQTELDVLDHVEPRHQRVLLEHDAALGAGTDYRLAVEQDFARRERHEAGDARKERRLAASGRAERDDEIAGIECQVDVRQCVRAGRPVAAGVVDGEMADFELAQRNPYFIAS